MDKDSAMAPVLGSIAARFTRKGNAPRLWVPRKCGIWRLECTGCGRRIEEVAELYEWAVQDLPWSEYHTSVLIALSPALSGVGWIKTRRTTAGQLVALHKRFAEVVGEAGESVSVRGMAGSLAWRHKGVRAIKLRCLWAKGRLARPGG